MKENQKIIGMHYLKGWILQMSESNVLTSIVEGVLEDLEKRRIPISTLNEQLKSAPDLRGAYKSLSKPGMRLIAEIKRSSPSKGALAEIDDAKSLASKYQEGGADVISVLTEERRFKGSISDLIDVRNSIELPVLRKDFIVTEYQVLESRVLGADLILLIAAVLTRDEIKSLSAFAKSLGLEVLLEVHNQEELEKSIMPSLDMIGVNNRNLKTFEVSLDFSKTLADQIPNEFVKVSESGISSIEAINELKPFGYQGFLIGENFMKTDNAGQAAKEFIAQL